MPPEPRESEVSFSFTVAAGIPITSLVDELLDKAMIWSDCQPRANVFERCEITVSTDDGPRVLRTIWSYREDE